MIRRRLYVEERMSRLAVWSLRLAVFALPVTAIGIACYFTEVFDLTSALYAVLAGVALAALALLLALAAFVVIWNEGLRGLGRVIGAGALALALIAPTAGLAAFGARLPVLHEVSTDLDDPPVFVTLAVARSRAANSLDGPDEAAVAAQEDAYPAIHPMDFDSAPDDVFNDLMVLVARRKWTVVDAVPPRGGQRDGRIEAVARGLPLGLRDDIVIRVRRTAEGTRVDMRSVTRNAARDFGTNARRIDDLLGELAERQGKRRR
ncbi:DUF1499 domain-containing protein [Ancylobacter defluvii]|uniref:DUF1499 domain-containing protein n=1 Tax=Ancylobacter defluvii TaxID=1282440 RepID=A0A9W6JUW6_9HYPH|nr:DUF1499 domain-containing protein [Ancylobacter defluvii]MBS7589876.1 DUF1499 domain-containing protein [Ancylobacter defluvii]GLK82998.1 hypothetical protein GCM10017653_10670 [Ancylobacter defluvii]